jgi:hypothetical protein
MTTNKTWASLTLLRTEVRSLCRRYADGQAIDIADELGRLDRLSRPVGKRAEIEKLIRDGLSDAEIVKALGVKKQQVNLIRHSMKGNA